MTFSRITKRFRYAHGDGWDAAVVRETDGSWTGRLTVRVEGTDPEQVERAIRAMLERMRSAG